MGRTGQPGDPVELTPGLRVEAGGLRLAFEGGAASRPPPGASRQRNVSLRNYSQVEREVIPCESPSSSSLVPVAKSVTA